MASHLAARGLLHIALFLSAVILSAVASDPQPLQDYCVTDGVNKNMIFVNGFPCKNPTHVVSADFKSSLLKKVGNTDNPLGVAITGATAFTFGALNTQGLTFVRTDLAKGGLVPPHVHPRASEILFVSEGTVSVGFVDTNNTLFSESLQGGDLWVFPRGLVHYILNIGKEKALTFSGLNSQNPGASLISNALFASKPSIPDEVLEKAFRISEEQVDHLKKVIGRMG